MIRVSTRGCYGLRAMLELALRYGSGPVLMRDIAESQGVSRKYLHALLTALKSGGLVRSVRGAAGGYVLARSPTEIRVTSVIQALEGSLNLTDCVDNPQTCGRSSGCVTHEIWRGLSRSLEQQLSQLTLQDLVVRHASKSAETTMYYI